MTQKTETVFIGAKLPRPLAEKLKASAKRERRTMSNMLAVFLERGDNHLLTGKR
jgi:hypothetical protein